MQPAALLFQLQQLDLELDRLLAEKQAIEHTLLNNETLLKLRKEYETARQQAQAGAQTQKEAEWVLDDITHRLQNQEQRLFDGTAKAKDLPVLQQEVQRLRAQQNRQEETVLELIDIAESLQEAAEQKLRLIKKAEQQWTNESATLIERTHQLADQAQQIQNRRDQQAGALPVALLERYTTLRRSKQGRAISRVEQNSCQWCRVILTASELQRLRVSADLYNCTNCGRILFYDRTQ
jgi:predicted  nucleic acid-binding Zn-ribbon protein